MKKSFLIPNLEGQMERWPISQIIGGLFVIAILIVYGCSMHAQKEADKFKTAGKDLKVQPDSLSKDSLIKENALLREILNSQLISHCDTLTPDQKIAQLRLKKYVDAVSAEYNRQKRLLEEARDNEENEAFKDKAARDNEYDFAFQTKRVEAIRVLEKNYPEDFLRYATVVFMERECSDQLYDGETRRLEKELAPIRAYYAAFMTADAEHDAKLRESDRICITEITKIGKAYQIKLDALEQQYATKIAKKSDQLGLVASAN